MLSEGLFLRSSKEMRGQHRPSDGPQESGRRHGCPLVCPTLAAPQVTSPAAEDDLPGTTLPGRPLHLPWCCHGVD
jgi:hypothetical protein